MRASIVFAVLLGACTLSNHPVELGEVAAQAPSFAASGSGVGPITHEAVVSGRWAVPLSGLLDLDQPDVPFEDGDTPIVLPVHLLTHPQHGTFIIDTGAPAGMAEGKGPTAGTLVGSFVSNMEVVRPLADILPEAGIAGVWLTHAHVDHVLGLPDVPVDVPVWVGPGELNARKAEHAFLRTVMGRVLDGRDALQTWPFAQAGHALGPVDKALDIFGDGSVYALHVPGHTSGSTAFLARTTEGAKLFTGDCSHTLWGWEHGVTPGSFTADHGENLASLTALKALAEAWDAEVFVGHELDGVGTGPDDR